MSVSHSVRIIVIITGVMFSFAAHAETKSNTDFILPSFSEQYLDRLKDILAGPPGDRSILRTDPLVLCLHSASPEFKAAEKHNAGEVYALVDMLHEQAAFATCD